MDVQGTLPREERTKRRTLRPKGTARVRPSPPTRFHLKGKSPLHAPRLQDDTLPVLCAGRVPPSSSSSFYGPRPLRAGYGTAIFQIARAYSSLACSSLQLLLFLRPAPFARGLRRGDFSNRAGLLVAGVFFTPAPPLFTARALRARATARRFFKSRVSTRRWRVPHSSSSSSALTSMPPGMRHACAPSLSSVSRQRTPRSGMRTR